jgi:hypothetical protein
MKAVTAKTVKTEMASVETANLAKPEKTATKAATSKVETKVAKQDVGNAASSIPVKPTKTAVEKVAAKKVVTKTVPIKAGTAKATASKVDKHEISKPKVEKISVAKSDVTQSTAKKMALYENEWVVQFIEWPSEGTRNPVFRTGNRPC